MPRLSFMCLTGSLGCCLAACGGPQAGPAPAPAERGAPSPTALPDPPANTPPTDAEHPPADPPSVALGDEAIALADSVDAARYEADLRFIAAERPPGSPHWRAVQDHCATELSAAGFQVERFSPGGGAGTSVIGTKLGEDPTLPQLVVGAHYEHIPGCAGANDNASGAAAALELARVLGPKTWAQTLIVACWDEEESGLWGSRAWVDAAVASGQAIALYLNFDTMGYTDERPGSQRLPPGIGLAFPKQVAAIEAREFRADFIAALSDSSAQAASSLISAHAERLGLPLLALVVPSVLKNSPMLADLRRSDHANFWHHDIPSLFVSDTADFRADTYHCLGRPDTADTLDLPFATLVVRAATGTLADLLGAPPAHAPADELAD